MRHTLTIAVQTPEGRVSASIARDADGEENYDITADGGESPTTTPANVNFLLAKLESFYLVSDKALTLKTNDSGTPDDTISLTANHPLIYYKNGPIANPFSEDVSAFYFVNAGTADATVKIRILEDSN